MMRGVDEQRPEGYVEPHDPGSAIAAAGVWLKAVLVSDDLATGWPRTDPELRRALAQGWLAAAHFPEELATGALADLAERAASLGLDELASGLARGEAPTDEPLWPVFEVETVEALADKWSFYDHETWGVWDRSEPLAEGLVVVYFVDPRNPEFESRWWHGQYVREVQADTPLHVLPLVMRWTPEGWLVAGFSQAGPPTPGWPPRWPSGPRPT